MNISEILNITYTSASAIENLHFSRRLEAFVKIAISVLIVKNPFEVFAIQFYKMFYAIVMIYNDKTLFK